MEIGPGGRVAVLMLVGILDYDSMNATVKIEFGEVGRALRSIGEAAIGLNTASEQVTIIIR